MSGLASPREGPVMRWNRLQFSNFMPYFASGDHIEYGTGCSMFKNNSLFKEFVIHICDT